MLSGFVPNSQKRLKISTQCIFAVLFTKRGDVCPRKKREYNLIMSTVKNGKVGTLDTMSQTVWHETDDLQYYREIHGNQEGTQERHGRIKERFSSNDDCVRKK